MAKKKMECFFRSFCASFDPSATASTSRKPSSFTPIVTSSDTLRTSPPQLRFNHKPSRNRYGWLPSIGRWRQLSICAQIFWFNSLTVLGLTRVPRDEDGFLLKDPRDDDAVFLRSGSVDLALGWPLH
jgi:hypothetical protein